MRYEPSWGWLNANPLSSIANEIWNATLIENGTWRETCSWIFSGKATWTYYVSSLGNENETWNASFENENANVNASETDYACACCCCKGDIGRCNETRRRLLLLLCRSYTHEQSDLVHRKRSNPSIYSN